MVACQWCGFRSTLGSFLSLFFFPHFLSFFSSHFPLFSPLVPFGSKHLYFQLKTLSLSFFFLGFSWLTLILSPLLHSSSIYPHFSQLKLFFSSFSLLNLAFSLQFGSHYFFSFPLYLQASMKLLELFLNDYDHQFLELILIIHHGYTPLAKHAFDGLYATIQWFQRVRACNFLIENGVYMQWRRMTCCLVFIGSRERESVAKARQKQWEK